MAGQTQVYLWLIDTILLRLREQWAQNPAGFAAAAQRAVAALPTGMVTQVTMVNAQGDAVLEALGALVPRTMADRAHFQDLRDGGDRQVLGEPVRSRRHGQWVVALVHPSGRIIARSLDNGAAVGQMLPADRPFMIDRQAPGGTFRQQGMIDEVPRVFGWLQWRLERGQEETRQSRQRLQEAQRTAQLGHWRFDSSKAEMFWSSEVYRIFGQDPAHFSPSFERYWTPVYPDEKARLQKLFDAALADRTSLDDVHRIVRPDGTERYVRLLCDCASVGQGTVYQGRLQEVTELQQAQNALQQLNSGLEQRVKKRTQELQALNQELKSFTYSVSHDLRTPLRSIHGFATLLRETEAGRLSEEGRDFLRRIQDSSRRMGLLIADLLSMAQHSRAELHPEWVDISALAQQVVAKLERAEPQRRVSCHIEPGLRIQADPTLMRVVLQNLLANAWKYTGQTADARISLRGTGTGTGTGTGADELMGFCVQDNGAGFDMAFAEQLLQPFKRPHAHHEFEGTGIGLATVERVVRRHGGRVRGEGAVGRGATFCFALPSEPVRQFGDSLSGSAGNGR